MSNTSDKRTNKIKFSFIGLIIATLIIIILILVFLIFSQNRKKAAPADSGNVIDVISDSIDNAIMGEEGSVYTISEGTIHEILEINKLSTIEYTYISIAKAYVDDTIEDEAEKIIQRIFDTGFATMEQLQLESNLIN